MENSTSWRYTVSFGLSLALCSVLNALLVAAKEKSPALMAGMAKITGHHWMTHTVIMLVLFFIFGWGFAMIGRGRPSPWAASRLIKTIVAGVVLGSLLIIGFYLIAD